MKKKILYAVIAVLALAIVIVPIVFNSMSKKEDGGRDVPVIEDYDRETIFTTGGIVGEKMKFDTKIVKDALVDMGVLITEEYSFTEVTAHSEVSTFLGYEIPFTESSYLVSYDGHVSAGIDFTKVKVSVNEDIKTVTVTLPDAEIIDTVIDPESFVLYEEKTGLGNHISVETYNRSLIELKKNAEDKAKEKGVIDRAAENGRTLIENLVRNLVDEDYRIIYK